MRGLSSAGWIGVALAGLLLGCSPTAPKPKPVLPPAPAAEAAWPWASARKESLREGVSRWQTRSKDGTDIQLIEFDLAAHPKLRFELYDQDEDDAAPFDNRADYYPHGVGWVTRHLNETRGGRIVAAWNGLFFAYDRRPNTGPNGVAAHIGPNVIRGVVRHNVGQHRWTFGVRDNRPKALHKPDKATMQREFDFAADGAQLLVREGKPLRLAPFPQPGETPPRLDSSQDAGSIPLVDWMRTSRTSMGWSRDGKRLWLLVVVESDHELGSKLALKRGEADPGGWTLADLQRFWLAFGAWGAVNSDGGAVTQLVTLQKDGGYEMVPPRIASPERRLSLGPDLNGAPEGGTLMTFTVREAP